MVNIYKTVYDASHTFLVILNQEGFVIDVNEAALSIGGFKKEHVINRPLWLCPWWLGDIRTQEIIKDASDSMTNPGHKFIRLGVDLPATVRHVTDFDLIFRRVSPGGESPSVIIVEGRDVTILALVTRSLASLQERIEALVSQSPSAIATLDANMRYMYVSDLWIETYQLPPRDEIIGEDYYEISPETPAEWREIHKKCLNGSLDERKAVPFDRADGTREYLNWRIHPWYTPKGDIGGLFMLTVVSTDEVKTKNALDYQYEQARVNKGLLEEFTYALAHDMRQPIRSAISFIGLMRREELTEKTTEYVNYIQSYLEQMGQHLEGVLQYAKTGFSIDKTDVSMNDVVTTSMSQLDSFIKESGATVLVGDLPPVKGDKLMLVQVYNNLINNGIKYGRDGVTPRIEIGFENDTYFVRDNGVGVENDYLQRIFDLFYHMGEPEGTGVGLAICNRIIALHGGDIWAESELGEGTTFFFTVWSRSIHERTT